MAKRSSRVRERRTIPRLGSGVSSTLAVGARATPLVTATSGAAAAAASRSDADGLRSAASCKQLKSHPH